MSRNRWDNHEPRMWTRAARLSDGELTKFNLNEDLVLVSSAATTYGTIILGKIRIPAINDDQGEGFIHVRYVIYDTLHNRRSQERRSHPSLSLLESTTHPTEYHRFHLSPPIALLTLNLYQGTEDVTFHSILTDEGNRDEDGHPTTWQAIQTADTPLAFFNE